MYALALKGKTSPKLLTSHSIDLITNSIAWSFFPRGNDTHFIVVLLVRFGALAEIGAYHPPYSKPWQCHSTLWISVSGMHLLIKPLEHLLKRYGSSHRKCLASLKSFFLLMRLEVFGNDSACKEICYVSKPWSFFDGKDVFIRK
ncbi:hypothetical protein PIB30_083665 [Stylosanthes scabra]|uniref:Uncharacterized protein n=1 Tax=Stylosanthes scabra TaxID=79078 RepID=A0ABU6SSI6_9FABA|nr:hypothetical protein [Stylosanthes scabra]